MGTKPIRICYSIPFILGANDSFTIIIYCINSVHPGFYDLNSQSKNLLQQILLILIYSIRLILHSFIIFKRIVLNTI